VNIAMKVTLNGLIHALRLDAQRLADAVEFGPAEASRTSPEPLKPPTRTMRSDDDERRRD
jgi:hypothetical protein